MRAALHVAGAVGIVVLGGCGSGCGGTQDGAAAEDTARCPEDMVYVPGGTFRMGTELDFYNSRERPVHEVTLSGYCFARLETTVGEYRACVAAGACKPPFTGVSCNAYGDIDAHPQNCVSWDDATAFCRYRGARLPTEAEWEFAARGPEGRTYPWGETPPTPAHGHWGGFRGREHTAPVGTHPEGQTPLGIHDLAGNVLVWVADWFEGYSAEPQRDPRGPRNGEFRVTRGSAFDMSRAIDLRASRRSSSPSHRRSYHRGIRCAADPS